MPKRSIYLKDEEDQLYERVKQLTEESGDTIGGVFVRAMQEYIAAKENEQTGMVKNSIFIGHDDQNFGSQGETVEFIGKLIGTGSTKDPQSGWGYYEDLYRTRKNNFILITTQNEFEVTITKLEVIENINELKKRTLPASIMSALKNEKAAVRFLDV